MCLLMNTLTYTHRAHRDHIHYYSWHPSPSWLLPLAHLPLIPDGFSGLHAYADVDVALSLSQATTVLPLRGWPHVSLGCTQCSRDLPSHPGQLYRYSKSRSVLFYVLSHVTIEEFGCTQIIIVNYYINYIIHYMTLLIGRRSSV